MKRETLKFERQLLFFFVRGVRDLRYYEYVLVESDNVHTQNLQTNADQIARRRRRRTRKRRKNENDQGEEEEEDEEDEEEEE